MKSKNKTRQVVTKRFKLTKTGKLKRKACNTSHLSRKDDVNTTTRKKRMVKVTGRFAKKIKKMMPKN